MKTIRVQMPDINTNERWKRGAVKEVKKQEEADELVAQGGVILPEEEEGREAPETVITSKSVKGHK